ncbi:MAG: putative rane protein [Anaerocolumna sp.]|jgi:hypothetical protein|nr:putative rane protein [Anaerocolumna sp.]
MSWGNSNGFNNGNRNQSLLCHICEFVGETVTIFTKSGGVSGCGFTGVVLAVNCDFVRLVTHQGSAPVSPIGGPNSSCCNDLNNDNYNNNYHNNYQHYSVGSVCDIPIDKIAAFCHNAI